MTFLMSCVSTGDTVKIGDISYNLKTPRNPELVPLKHSMCLCLVFAMENSKYSEFTN